MVVLPVSDVVLSESAHEVLGVSEFVGRTAELARLDALLAGDARLITLVGPGGIGKTRLAAEALRRISHDQRRPVYWARLAEVERDDRLADEDVVRSVMRTDGSDPSEWDLLMSTFTDATMRRRAANPGAGQLRARAPQRRPGDHQTAGDGAHADHPGHQPRTGRLDR